MIRNQVHFLAFVLNAAFAVLWLLLGMMQGAEIHFLISIGHLAVAGLLMFPAFGSHRIAPFDPLNLVVLYVIIGGLAPIYFIAFDQTPRIQYLMGDERLPEFLEFGMWYAASMFLVGAGYAHCTRRLPAERVLPRESTLSGHGFQFALFAGVAIAAFAILSYIQSTGGVSASIADISRKRSIEVISNGEIVHATGGYLRMASDISTILLFVVMAFYLNRYPKVPLYITIQLWLLGAMSLIIPFISSSRSAVIFIVLGLLITLQARQRLSRSVVITCLCFALVAFGGMSALRSAAQQSGEAGFENPFLALAESGNGLSIFGTTQILNGVPEKMEYQLGATYLTWVFAPIPRSVWPGKPEVSLGKRVKGEILQRPVIRSGRPPSIINEGWINFGAVGFLLNAFLYGYLLRLIVNTLQPVMTWSSFAVPIYYTLSLNTAALVNSALSQGVVRVLTDVVLVIIVYILIQHSFARKPIVWRRPLAGRAP